MSWFENHDIGHSDALAGDAQTACWENFDAVVPLLLAQQEHCLAQDATVGELTDVSVFSSSVYEVDVWTKGAGHVLLDGKDCRDWVFCRLKAFV